MIRGKKEEKLQKDTRWKVKQHGKGPKQKEVESESHVVKCARSNLCRGGGPSSGTRVKISDFDGHLDVLRSSRRVKARSCVLRQERSWWKSAMCKG